jgi:hypothetical protein
LRDHQDLPTQLVEPTVHLAGFVAEQPKTGHLLGHPIYLPWRIAMGEPNQQAEPLADRTDRAAINRY